MRHVVPFQVTSFPSGSTSTQNVVVGQEMSPPRGSIDQPPLGSTPLSSVHLEPLYVTTLPASSLPTQNVTVRSPPLAAACRPFDPPGRCLAEWHLPAFLASGRFPVAKGYRPAWHPTCRRAGAVTSRGRGVLQPRGRPPDVPGIEWSGALVALKPTSDRLAIRAVTHGSAAHFPRADFSGSSPPATSRRPVGAIARCTVPGSRSFAREAPDFVRAFVRNPGMPSRDLPRTRALHCSHFGSCQGVKLKLMLSAGEDAVPPDLLNSPLVWSILRNASKAKPATSG